MSQTKPRSTAGESVPVGHLSVDIESRPTDQSSFLISHQQQRLRGAFALSLFAHTAAVLLVIYVITRVPEATTASAVIPPLPPGIIWLSEPGPGGGGGGGGNQNPEPPRRAELTGKDKLTVPVLKAPDLTKPKDDPKPEEQLNIPAKTLAASEQTIAGIIDALPSGSVSQGPGTNDGAGSGRGTGIGPGVGSGLGPGYGGGFGGGAYRPGSGVDNPRVIREVKPAYTSDAMRAKIQGIVLLQCVVNPDGTVGPVEVLRSLDSSFGLDQEAIKAARQWRFIPGTLRGQPVPVQITIEMTFTLR